jgi:hypothetical protein
MGLRVICYCADCRAFACFLGCESEFLDAAGGTDICQTSPSRLEITEGTGNIKRVRVTPKGLHRWYAACCSTPLANTFATRAMPFAGTYTLNYDAGRREAALRSPVAVVFAKEAQGAPAAVQSTPMPLLLLDLMRRAAAEWITGKWKGRPLHDAADAGVIAPPRILLADERRTLDVKAALGRRDQTTAVSA